eukprot:2530265-Prymnesium_polylepis.1
MPRRNCTKVTRQHRSQEKGEDGNYGNRTCFLSMLIISAATLAAFDDREPNPPLPYLSFGACHPKLLGSSMDAPSHDLLQTPAPQTSEACAEACCANAKCAGALFESASAVTYGGCTQGKPCCFLKTSVADAIPASKPVAGGSELWQMLGRSQDDEHLNFLSATLGSHMVLQRAPQQATLWGHTAPGATVTTVMMSDTQHETLKTTAGTDGTWRQALPPVAASKRAYNFTMASSNSSAERATLVDVLFGDVYSDSAGIRLERAVPRVPPSALHGSTEPCRPTAACACTHKSAASC